MSALFRTDMPSSQHSQAVRRAGSVRDDVMPGGVVDVLIYPQDKSNVLSGGRVVKRRRDDHLLHRTVEVGTGLRGVSEVTGTLDNDPCAHLPPGNLFGVTLRKDGDTLAIDDQIMFHDLDRCAGYLGYLFEKSRDCASKIPSPIASTKR